MRILTVCSCSCVFGTEIITLKLLEEFRQRAHQQLAVTTFWSDPEFDRRLKRIGIAEMKMPFGAVAKKVSPRALWWTANTLVRLPSLWMRWLRTIRSFNPHVILWTSARQPLLLLPLLRAQVSFVIQHEALSQTPANSRLYRTVARHVTGFVAVSAFVSRTLINAGVPADKVHVIMNGPLHEHSQFSSAQLYTDVSLPIIGFCGRLSARKGLEALIASCRILKERGLNFFVKVFGNGETDYVRFLEHKVAAAGLTGVWKWMGYVSDPHRIYERMDICVVPSSCDEAFGLSAVEACSFGVPVVVSRRGGLTEVVEDGITGCLVDSDSPQQFADRLEWLIGHRAQAQAMGAAGREHVFRHFTVKRMVNEFENLLLSHVCNESPAIGADELK